MRKVFKEGNYSRVETTLGNTASVQIFNKNNIRFLIRVLKTRQILNSALSAKSSENMNKMKALPLWFFQWHHFETNIIKKVS